METPWGIGFTRIYYGKQFFLHFQELLAFKFYQLADSKVSSRNLATRNAKLSAK